jgi:hypothetical protein
MLGLIVKELCSAATDLNDANSNNAMPIKRKIPPVIITLTKKQIALLESQSSVLNAKNSDKYYFLPAMKRVDGSNKFEILFNKRTEEDFLEDIIHHFDKVYGVKEEIDKIMKEKFLF